MSLINEALRKARQAASEHDSKEAEGPFQPPKAYPSRGSGRRSPVLTMVLIAVGAGVVGAAVAWWILADHQDTSLPAVELEPVQEVEIEKEPAEVSSSPPAESTNEDDATVTSAATAPTPITDQLAVPEAEARPVTEQDVVEPAPPVMADEEVAESSGDRVFIMEAELGAVTLSLGFIVARPENPFAEINGVEVYVGSEIEGFVVESIDADRVTLRDEDGELILRVP